MVFAISVLLPNDTWSQNIQGYVFTGPQHGYIGRRISRNLFPGWMEWTELDLNFPKGIFVNLWDSTEIEKHLPEMHKGDELDLTLGWRGEIGNGFKMRLSTTLFNLYPKDKWWAGDVGVESFWFSRDFVIGNHTLKPPILVVVRWCYFRTSPTSGKNPWE